MKSKGGKSGDVVGVKKPPPVRDSGEGAEKEHRRVIVESHG